MRGSAVALAAALALVLPGSCSLHGVTADDSAPAGALASGAGKEATSLEVSTSPSSEAVGAEVPNVREGVAAGGPNVLQDARRMLHSGFDRETRPARQWEYISTAADATCRAELEQMGAKFKSLPDVAKPNRNGCGVPHGVLLSRGPTGIVYSPPIQVDCSLALRLQKVEQILQEEAAQHLGGELARVITLGSYACRPVVGRLAGKSGGISEHSFGNAVDIARFEPKRGRAASVLRDYKPGEAAESGPTRFLRAVTKRLRSEGAIRRVLGPDFDASHRDHLHLDQGTPWWH
ncbi:extensin family protein [Chondromyces crocatus]|uniref:Extensin-like C-terminal domain-containing protein n=1 Tax=Chondromyces crocatus TaxID=52 RepID=A0A0K1EDM6_CHOCO|nr:extensin family protein [Chondromyces crocatus]AKT38980.1 uncharacterized protein CMC5_031270 [Chondromyces crocatus]